MPPRRRDGRAKRARRGSNQKHLLRVLFAPSSRLRGRMSTQPFPLISTPHLPSGVPLPNGWPPRRCKLVAGRDSNGELMTTTAATTEGLRLTQIGDKVCADLPERFAAGQAGAFEELVALYQPRVARL